MSIFLNSNTAGGIKMLEGNKKRGGGLDVPRVAGPRTPLSSWLTVSSAWRGTVGGTRAKEALQ